MPSDFPAWARVHAFFRRWREHGLITEFHDRLRGTVSEREGREAEPTAGNIDAQSVRAAATVPAASRGYDGGKEVPGRKRHIVTDTLGLLLAVAVTAANIGDLDAAAGLLVRLRRLHRDITLVWADGGYTGSLVGGCRDKLALTLDGGVLRGTGRKVDGHDQVAGFGARTAVGVGGVAVEGGSLSSRNGVFGGIDDEHHLSGGDADGLHDAGLVGVAGIFLAGFQRPAPDFDWC